MAYSDLETPDTTAQSTSSSALNRCGMARAALLLGDKWTLLVVREALYGVTRFDEMQANLNVPRTVLSNRLKRLVSAGVLKKRLYKAPGARSRYRYVLTPMGMDLALPLIALMQWGEKHLPEDDNAPAAAIVERATGAPLRVGLARRDGKPVALGDAHFRISNSD